MGSGMYVNFGWWLVVRFVCWGGRVVIERE